MSDVTVLAAGAASPLTDFLRDNLENILLGAAGLIISVIMTAAFSLTRRR